MHLLFYLVALCVSCLPSGSNEMGVKRGRGENGGDEIRNSNNIGNHGRGSNSSGGMRNGNHDVVRNGNGIVRLRCDVERGDQEPYQRDDHSGLRNRRGPHWFDFGYGGIRPYEIPPEVLGANHLHHR